MALPWPSRSSKVFVKARSSRDFSRVMTTMRGTIGYLAPEWISGTAITTKADVFSYGMMLFEIISHKRNVDPGRKFFPVLVAEKLIEEEEGDVPALLDADVAGEVDVEELERACMEDESMRPTMGAVVQMLEGHQHTSFLVVWVWLSFVCHAARPSCAGQTI
nr:unnamed protein product [Digitaria exilis]